MRERIRESDERENKREWWERERMRERIRKREWWERE